MSGKDRYNQFVKEHHQGCAEVAPEIGVAVEDIAAEAADDILDENLWVGEFLEENGITDIKGRLIDDISSGTGF